VEVCCAQEALARDPPRPSPGAILFGGAYENGVRARAKEKEEGQKKIAFFSRRPKLTP
jgi:hypothetical protein